MKPASCFTASIGLLISVVRHATAASYGNSTYSFSQHHGDSVLPSRTTDVPSSTAGNAASSLSSITGPSMWAYSYTWSKYIEPTIVGTVKVTFNKATNQTAATTVLHSEYRTNNSMQILTRTNTNAAGTQTAAAEAVDGRNITLAYPTPYVEFNSEMSWGAILPTVQNNTLTCCRWQTTSSPTPTHTPFTAAAQTTDTADPSGWLYTLIGVQYGDPTTWLMGPEISSWWPTQPLTLAYTGCPHAECPPTTSIAVDPVAFASEAAFLLDTTTTTISSAANEQQKAASKTAGGKTQAKADPATPSPEEPATTSEQDSPETKGSAIASRTAKAQTPTIADPSPVSTAEPGDETGADPSPITTKERNDVSGETHTSAIQMSAGETDTPAEAPSQLSAHPSPQTTAVEVQPAKASNQEQPIGWFVRESNVDPAPSSRSDPKSIAEAHTDQVDAGETTIASLAAAPRASDTGSVVDAERTGAQLSPSVLVDPIAATRASSRTPNSGSGPPSGALQTSKANANASPDVTSPDSSPSVLVDPIEATRPVSSIPARGSEATSSTRNIGGYIWSGLGGTTSASSTSNAQSRPSSTVPGESSSTSSPAAQQTTSGGSSASQLRWDCGVLAGILVALMLL